MVIYVTHRLPSCIGDLIIVGKTIGSKAPYKVTPAGSPWRSLRLVSEMHPRYSIVAQTIQSCSVAVRFRH